ncbi:hypothetical protein [Cellulomonas xylanilytica]|uniref:Integral membrane protein n=1 Tax=Cellulomonas xylanilytica TaxID=233583 RepID=A0A510V3U9_9CELL|nr:hypothetical protein [Cellulomonas xylanilytica]GEK19795.1 hypothetical protein CXY01_03150 [Cellulomonas xylanilytica]
MGLALVCVGVAALCSGTAIVLQAVAARRLPADVRLDAALVGGLARSPLYLLALGLVALGFALSFVALRTLPVFAVQAGRASSLAVAAVLSVVVLGARLRWTDWLGLGSIAVGLVVLALAVAPQTTITPAAGTPWVVVGATVTIAALAATLALGPPTPWRGLLLATLAGAAFGVLALGAHTVDVSDPVRVLTDPVAWCAGLCGGLGLAVSALALRRAGVVAVTALMVGTETVVGAGLGILLAGDRPAAGAGAASVAAFALVLAGALVVARFGSPPSAQAELGSSDPRAAHA